MPALFDQPTMHLFALCATILVLKMAMTGYATAVARNVKGVFISPEDYAFRGKEAQPPDEQVERIRRAHHNDLEAVLPFLTIGFLFALRQAASYEVARWLFVTFTVARIGHTVVYAAGLQPWRSILFAIADVAMLAMTVLLLVSLL